LINIIFALYRHNVVSWKKEFFYIRAY
jgi:hypothetical protein